MFPKITLSSMSNSFKCFESKCSVIVSRSIRYSGGSENYNIFKLKKCRRKKDLRQLLCSKKKVLYPI